MFCSIVPDKLLRNVHASLSLEDPLKKSLEETLLTTKRAKGNWFSRMMAKWQKPPVDKLKQRKIYDMQSQEDPLPGQFKRNEGGVPNSDDLVNYAYDYSGVVFDFYKTMFDRESVDNKGMTLISSVHFAVQYDNAFWNSQQMVYGDGDLFLPLVKGLDVDGHELTHGVTERTCGLVYWAQPGALNESISDVFGVTIKAWHQGKNIKDMDWLVGADIVSPKFPGKALRSFLDEKANDYDDQPKNFKDLYRGFDDNAGVHTNSGIPNHAYYLFCQKIGGNAWDTPIQIWYETLKRIPKTCLFSQFAKTTVQVAQEKYGDFVSSSLTAAWSEVGLPVK